MARRNRKKATTSQCDSLTAATIVSTFLPTDQLQHKRSQGPDF